MLDLVEGPLGLLDLLDEQCRFPTASAEDLAVRYTQSNTIKASPRWVDGSGGAQGRQGEAGAHMRVRVGTVR